MRDTDQHVRHDATLEERAKLRPVFAILRSE